MNEQNQFLDWDGVLENDGSEFPVLPEGDYAFEVTGFERVTMNWNAVIGARGRAHFVVDKYTDRNGQERENNKVGKYLEYAKSLMPKPAGVDENGFMQIPECAAEELPFD